MKIVEIQELEREQIELLRERSGRGDNQAAAVLLEHLRQVSIQISKWKAEKDASEHKKK